MRHILRSEYYGRDAGSPVRLKYSVFQKSCQLHLTYATIANTKDKVKQAGIIVEYDGKKPR